MSKVDIFIGFIIGVGIGCAGTYFWYNAQLTDMQNKLQKDINDYKEKLGTVNKNYINNLKEQNPDCDVCEVNTDIVISKKDKSDKFEKINYSGFSNQDFEKSTINDIYGRLAMEEHPSDEEDLDKVHDKNPPKLIKADEYGDNPKFDCKSLIYYVDDNVLATENDEVIDDVNRLVGDCLTKFGFTTNDENIIFVRNYNRNEEYEITKVYNSFENLRIK